MKARIITVDSEITGANVLEIQDYDPAADFPQFEKEQVLPLRPLLVVGKVRSEDVPAIRKLEDNGFRFAEFQIMMVYHLRRRFDTSHYPYHWEAVTDTATLDQVLNLAATIFTCGRFTTDPQLGPELSGRRYQAYVRNSFSAPDEHVYVMKHDVTGRIVSFGTFRRTGPQEVRLLIGGVAPELKGTGLGTIHDYIGLNTYYDLGVRTVRTAVSGTNIAIINLEIAHLEFKVESTVVVLHKHYGSGKQTHKAR
jgi:hypothetical protein